MVFTGTRQSVDEIGDALSRASGDLLRVQRFVGQGGGDGMKQSSQERRRGVREGGVSRRPVVLRSHGIDSCPSHDESGFLFRV